MTLPDWLADPALLPVWGRLRAPLERGVRTTRVTGLDRATRHALSGVLGRPLVGDVPLVLADVSALLESRAGLTLEEVVVAATGPLRDRAAEQALRAEPLAVLAAVDPSWAEDVRRSGLLTRVPDAEVVARHAVAVRALLPASPARLRTELAVAVTGDAHALDEGRALAAVVLRCLAGGSVPATAALRRKLWEESGVLADTVSTSVLTLGLRPVASGPREQALRDAGDRGDPVHLTPWDLRRVDVALGRGRVLVVENPSVLESFAVRHGGRFALVCTAGWPAAVALDLLDRLGMPLAYHGDFDWRGVEICNWLIERRSVQPWRMSAADYLAAPGGGPLTGREVATPWDPELAAVMRERGVAVHEEQVVDVLLAEWSGQCRPKRPLMRAADATARGLSAPTRCGGRPGSRQDRLSDFLPFQNAGAPRGRNITRSDGPPPYSASHGGFSACRSGVGDVRRGSAGFLGSGCPGRCRR